ncbi:transaldolase [Colletotrichum truncatum]|uniref:Transaldolase n=1 Tax=Colletotrichum truncatum TaxID=5467 RepID=A0ACC3YNE7_COLTU|nr:transaldolase [Colletotrichum truncatum]KAF6789489.1 transaldolase [Colletotrichum truncatum]
MGNTTWLDKLQEQLKIDIDCVDPAEAKRFLPFKFYDQTSNQRLVYEQMIAPENHELFLKTVKDGKDEGWEVILDRMSALLCAKNIENIQGRVLLQTSAFHAYDTEKIIAHARSYAREFEKLGIPKDRICIKIPATGPALNAGPILLKEGIRTLGTSLFSVSQAIAASQAGCLSISPYYNLPWYHADKANQWPKTDDPALEHPMSSRIIQMQQVYKRLREETGKEQPLLKPASFISASEAMAMGEFGCEHATIPEDILLRLSLLDAEANPPPGDDAPKRTGVPSPRVAHLASTDPLAGPNWDGKLASTDVDYLADDGAALEKAIAEDPVTERGLREALAMFQSSELQSKNAIEELLKQA